MRTFVSLVIAAVFAFPLSASDWRDREPVQNPGVQPVAELQSNGTAIIDFVGGSQAAVVARMDSRLETRLAPSADQIVKMPHALFVLADGTVVMKAIMYRWTTPVDVQIAVPYSDKWQVSAVYVGGIMDYAKVNTVPPMFLSGRDFSSGIAAAAVITVDDEPRRIGSDMEASGCVVIGGGCKHCWVCWLWFCSDPYEICSVRLQPL